MSFIDGSSADETILSPYPTGIPEGPDDFGPNSVAWWVTAVVAGVIASLLAGYVRPRLDALLATVSNKWATRTKQKREEFWRELEKLRASQHEQVLAAISASRRETEAATTFLFGSFLCLASFVTGHEVFFYLSVPFFLFGVFYRGQALGIEAKLDLARERNRDESAEDASE